MRIQQLLPPRLDCDFVQLPSLLHRDRSNLNSFLIFQIDIFYHSLGFKISGEIYYFFSPAADYEGSG